MAEQVAQKNSQKKQNHTILRLLDSYRKDGISALDKFRISLSGASKLKRERGISTGKNLPTSPLIFA